MSEQPRALDLRPFGEIVSFTSTDDVKAWISNEHARWTPILNSISRASPHHYARTVCNALQQKIDSAIGLVQNVADEYARRRMSDEDLLADAIAQLQSHYFRDDERYIPVESPAGRYVAALGAKDANLAWAVLANFLQIRWASRSMDPGSSEVFSNVVRGATHAELFLLGLDSRADAEAAALEKLRQQWESDLSSQKLAHAEHSNLTDGALANFRKDSTKHINDAESDLKIQRKAFSEAINLSKDEFTNLNKVYSEHLSLRASVQYWRKRQLKSSISSIALLSAALYAGITLVTYFTHLVSPQNYPTVSISTTLNPNASPQAPNSSKTADQAAPLLGNALTQTTLLAQATNALTWAHLSVAFSTLLFGAWGLRILLKIALELWVAGTDASERATMVESYLALMKESSGLPKEAVTILLQAIFRRGGSSSDAPALMELEAIKNAKEILK